jgi:hypothetical protein
MMTRAGRAAALLVAAVGLTGHVLLRPRLEARQVEAKLVIPSADQPGMAADLAVPTLALGAFRGLVVDYLWLRSHSFRAQGRHYEARQVAEQICRLQPRLPDVWAFLGHDLAYNVTAAVEDKDGRWRWIQNGIELLRDQGLRYNPGDPDLCFMLARIYQDKIGTTSDDYHMFFKWSHARLMADVLGDASPRALAAAPPFDALADAEARALLGQAAGAGLDGPAGILSAAASDAGEAALALRAMPAWSRVLEAARAQQVREVLGMEPAVLAQVDQLYGPLDWTGCDAATIYWAHVGLQGALERRQHRDAYALRRTILAGLKNVVRRGRSEWIEGGMFTAPMPELVLKIDQRLADELADAERVERELRPAEEAGALEPSEAERYDAAVTFSRNLHSTLEGFLCEGVVLLSEYGRELESKKLFARARRAFPDSPMLQLDYDEFILRVLSQRYADAGTYMSQQGMAQTIEGTWVSAYEALAKGQDDRFRGLEALALANERRWDAFLASLDEPDARARLGLDYRAIRRRSLFTAAQRMPDLLRERLAERAGLTVKELLTPPPPPTRGPR